MLEKLTQLWLDYSTETRLLLTISKIITKYMKSYHTEGENMSRPPSLSELAPMISNMGLTHFGSGRHPFILLSYLISNSPCLLIKTALNKSCVLLLFVTLPKINILNFLEKILLLEWYILQYIRYIQGKLFDI